MNTAKSAAQQRNVLAIIVSYLIVVAVAISNVVGYPQTRSAMIPLLAVFIVLMLLERWIIKLPRWISALYLMLQIGLMVWLFFIEPFADRTSLLLIPSCIFVMRYYSRTTGWIWIGIFTTVMSVMIYYGHKIYAPELIIIYIAAYVLVGSYALMLKETRRAQQESQVLLEQLRAYSNKVEELTSINERNRLARELHDSVTQTIFSMTLITRSTLILQERDPEQVPEKLRQLQDLAQDALTEMRALISQLRPLSVADDGLIAVLGKHIEEISKRSGVSISLDAPSDDLSLDAVQQQEVFRIIQEALNNIIKHAQATQACTRLQVADKQVMVTIQDNGVGFDPTSNNDKHIHFGLDSMKERTQEMGGIFEIISASGQGTEVIVRIPSPTKKDSHD
jgi:signal transduction histidine kinase